MSPITSLSIQATFSSIIRFNRSGSRGQIKVDKKAVAKAIERSAPK